MTPSQTYRKTQKIITKALDVYQSSVNAAQLRMWSSVFNTIRRLELTPEGNIVPNQSNFKIIRTLRGDLRKAIKNKQYRKATQVFLSRFSKVKSTNDTYYKGLGVSAFSATKTPLKEVLKMSVETTKNSLLSSGIDESVIRPVQDLLKTSITSGGSLSDLTSTLRTEIVGNTEKAGKMARYAKQITTDSINQFNANYNQAVSNDLKLEFYLYQGPIVEGSRDYCRRRVSEGRWFHIREIEATAGESWSGKIPSTSPSNILTNRGGFNCNHQYIPVSSDAVPKSVRDRAEAKGFYTPKN